MKIVQAKPETTVKLPMEIIALLPVLITFIFILIALISVARRLKKISEKSKKPSSRKQVETKPGWKDLLGDMLLQIKKEIRAAQERQEQLERDKKSSTGLEMPRRSTLVWEKNAPASSPPPVPVKEAKKQKKQIQPSETKTRGESTPEEPEFAKHPPREQFETTAAELRKAVVWSEILAPPLALREDQDQF